MLHDKFENSVDSVTAPASECFSITPSDTNELAVATKAIYIGSGGDLAVIAVGSDTPVTFRDTITGSILDIRVRQVLVTGTTAQELIGLA